jgi:hypothetical protein
MQQNKKAKYINDGRSIEDKTGQKRLQDFPSIAIAQLVAVKHIKDQPAHEENSINQQQALQQKQIMVQVIFHAGENN